MVKWLVVDEIEQASLEDELVLQVKELACHVGDDVEDIVDDMDVEALLVMQPTCMKGLIEDLKHEISILWLTASAFEVIMDPLQRRIAEEAQKVEIQHPEVLISHHEEYTFEHLTTKLHMLDIYLDVLHENSHLCTARRHEGFIPIGEVYSDAVPEDVNRMAHHHIVEFHSWREAKRVVDLLGLLVDLVLVYGITIDHLIQHVHFPPTGEHERILQSKRKLVFDLDVADSKAPI